MEQSILNETGTRVLSGAMGAASTRVYKMLRTRILNFDLRPDDTLSRGDLAKEFGVSQTPIREALHQLEQDGLVNVFPQSKTVVTRIDKSQLDETQFLRVALETEVVRRLATDQNPEALARASSIIRMQEALLDDPTQAEVFNELDRSFHQTLFQAVGMESLHRLLIGRLGHLARCQRLELPKAGRMSQIADAHRAIVDGIASGNPNDAADAMRQHITGTIRRVASLRKEFPEYFSGDS